MPSSVCVTAVQRVIWWGSRRLDSNQHSADLCVSSLLPRHLFLLLLPSFRRKNFILTEERLWRFGQNEKRASLSLSLSRSRWKEKWNAGEKKLYIVPEHSMKWPLSLSLARSLSFFSLDILLIFSARLFVCARSPVCTNANFLYRCYLFFNKTSYSINFFKSF